MDALQKDLGCNEQTTSWMRKCLEQEQYMQCEVLAGRHILTSSVHLAQPVAGRVVGKSCDSPEKSAVANIRSKRRKAKQGTITRTVDRQ